VAGQDPLVARELRHAVEKARLSDTALPHDGDDREHRRVGLEAKQLLSDRGALGAPACEEVRILYVRDVVVRVPALRSCQVGFSFLDRYSRFPGLAPPCERRKARYARRACSSRRLIGPKGVFCGSVPLLVFGTGWPARSISVA